MSKNIYLFTGPNTLFLRKDIQKWKQAFIEKYGEINVLEFSIGHVDSVQHIQSCLAPGFFGSKKMMIIHDVPSSTVQPKDWNENMEKVQQFFQKHIDEIPSDNFICFVQPVPDKRKSFTKFLIKNTEVKNYPASTLGEKRKYIEEQLPKIPTNLQTKIIERFGDNIELLDVEMQRLKLYKETDKITNEDIELLHGKKQEDVIFDIIDSILQGRREAVTMLESFLAHNSVYQLLPSISGNLRKTLYLLKCKEAGWNKDTIVKELKIHPYVYQKNVIHTDKKSQIEQLYLKLIQLDEGSKTGMLGSDAEKGLTQHLLQYILSFTHSICHSK